VRRAAQAALLVVCASAGLLGAVLLAGPLHAAVGTTGTDTEPPPPPSTTAELTLAPGVKVGGIEVGGLTPEVAFSVVRTAVDAPLTLRLERTTLKPSPAQFGITAYVQNAIARARSAEPDTDVPLLVRVDGKRVQAYVATLGARFDRRPVDSRVLLRQLRPHVTPAVPGRRIDRVAARQAITQALVRNERFPLTLPAASVPAAVTPMNIGPVVVIRRGSNRLHLFNGTKPVRTFTVATGARSYPTPLGRFSIVAKWANPWWHPPDSDWARGKKPVPPGPGNPLGTRWMGISSPGVGIHGTPDGASLGYSVSHGCIRMAIPDAEWLFARVRVGTTVFIVPA
jgi:lipoprotein-anchoring transpeptidase ErfK/SrfK